MAESNGGGNAPILTLSTKLPERETLSIDDKVYELARYHDLSLQKHGEFSVAYNKGLELYGEFFQPDAAGLSPEDAAFLEQRTGEQFAIGARLVIRKCPRREIDKLDIEQRMRVCAAFQRVVNRWRRGPGAPRVTAETGTGDASSTPSPLASGEAPAGGSGEPASENSLRHTGD